MENTQEKITIKKILNEIDLKQVKNVKFFFDNYEYNYKSIEEFDNECKEYELYESEVEEYHIIKHTLLIFMLSGELFFYRK